MNMLATLKPADAAALIPAEGVGNLSRRRVLGGAASLVLGALLPTMPARAQTNVAVKPGTRVPAFLVIGRDNSFRILSPFVEGASDLHATLRSRSIDSLIVTGTATNMCSESTARDAMMLDYKVIMVADANGARYPEDHMVGLTSFYQSFGDVRSTDEVLADVLPANA